MGFYINDTMNQLDLDRCGLAMLRGGSPDHGGIIKLGRMCEKWEMLHEERRRRVAARHAVREVALMEAKRTNIQQAEEDMFLNTFFDRLAGELDDERMLIARDLVEPRKAVLDFFPAERRETAVRKFWNRAKAEIEEIKATMARTYQCMTA